MFLSIYRSLKNFATNSEDMRQRLVWNGYFGQIIPGRIAWPNDPAVGSPEDWEKKMKTSGIFADHITLQIAANVLNRDIIVIPVFR